MKIITQLAILFAVGLAGSVCAALLPFPFPASVTAMLILLLLLVLKAVKLSQIETVGDFLLQNMMLLFIPGCADILDSLPLLKGAIPQMVVICIVSTVLTFLVTVYTVRLVVWLQKKCTGGKQDGTAV